MMVKMEAAFAQIKCPKQAEISNENYMSSVQIDVYRNVHGIKLKPDRR